MESLELDTAEKRASLLSILSKVIKMFNEIYNFLIAFYVYLI